MNIEFNSKNLPVLGDLKAKKLWLIIKINDDDLAYPYLVRASSKVKAMDEFAKADAMAQMGRHKDPSKWDEDKKDMYEDFMNEATIGNITILPAGTVRE